MTRPLRRDRRTKNASVITGVRLEADTARRLCDTAVERAADKHGRGDVAQLARYFVRRGLGLPHDEANRREEQLPLAACVAGLKVEADVCEQLTRVAHQLGITKSGAVRHFIRLGLGDTHEESRERETYFGELAGSHKSAGLAGAARFGRSS